MDSKTTEIIVRAKDEASSVLQKISGSMKGMGDDAKKFAGDAVRDATKVAAIGLAGLTAAAYDTVRSFNESEAVSTQLNAVLKSTANAAGVTKKELDDQSAALQKVTKFSDEAVGSVQAMLLTFTDVKGGIMKDATKTVLDMSQALGQDAKGSAIQLGKALNDPIHGITALTRVGVTFNDEQKTTIANLVAVGDKAGAQKIILAELQKEFGGSAEAAGKTFAGKLVILSNQLDNVKESIGGLITSALIPLVTWAAKVLAAIDWDATLARVQTAIKNVVSQIDKFTKPLQEFVQRHSAAIISFFKDFGTALLVIVPTLAIVGVAITVLSNPLVLIGLAVASLVALFRMFQPQLTALATTVINFLKPAFHDLSNAVKDFIPALEKLWTQVSPILIPALKILGVIIGATLLVAIYALIEGVKLTIQWWTFLANVWTAIIKAIKGVIDAIGDFAGAVMFFFKQAGDHVTGFFNGIKNWFDNLPNTISGGMNSAGTNISLFFEHLPFLAGMFLGQMARAFVDFVVVTVPNFIQGIINWFNALPGRLAAIGTNIWNTVANAFINTYNAAVNWTINLYNGVVHWFGALPGRLAGIANGLWNAVSGAFWGFYNSAVSWGNSLVNGIVSTLAGLPGKLVSSIKGAFASAGSAAASFAGGFTFGFGKREKGGPVSSQTPYIVGEKGPELFVPNTGGTIIPNHEMGGGGGTTTNIYGNITLASADAVESFFKKLGRNQELARMGLTTNGY